MFHANGLRNVNSCFSGNYRKDINLSSAELVQRVATIKEGNKTVNPSWNSGSYLTFFFIL